MKTHDRREFSRSVNQLFAIYGDEVTQQLLDAWWSILDPYRLDAVQAAMNLHASDIDKGRFRPTPADIRRHLEETLPAMGKLHCERILRASRIRIGVHREHIARLLADRQLHLVSDDELQTRIGSEHKHIAAIEAEPQYQAAMRGVSLLEPDTNPENLLPLAVRKSLGRLDG